MESNLSILEQPNPGANQFDIPNSELRRADLSTSLIHSQIQRQPVTITRNGIKSTNGEMLHFNSAETETKVHQIWFLLVQNSFYEQKAMEHKGSSSSQPNRIEVQLPYEILRFMSFCFRILFRFSLLFRKPMVNSSPRIPFKCTQPIFNDKEEKTETNNHDLQA